MGSSSRHRREKRKRLAEQQRRHQAAARPAPGAGHKPGPTGFGPAPGSAAGHRQATVSEIEAGLDRSAIEAALLSYAHGSDSFLFRQAVASLADIEEDPRFSVRPTTAASALILQLVTKLYEVGWQPGDLVHVVRRKWSARAGRLALAAVASEARMARATERAPAEWLDQLEDLDVYDATKQTIVGGHAAPVTSWARAERLHADEALHIALSVLGQLLRLPKLTAIVPAPSQWPSSNKGIMPKAVHHHGSVAPKTLALIRALLAKAEATTFEAEADAFTAKAQDLMTRYSIDAAFVAASGQDGADALRAGIASRRVHIESPYADEKATFLHVVAQVNTVKSIWNTDVGFCTLMGFPVDLDLTEMLFTSLLVQATRAAGEATSADRQARTASFKRAFLTSYAHRIGERLRLAGEQASVDAEAQYGQSLVPVLAAKADAIDEAYAQAFPNATTMRSRSYDAAGWYAGRAAADRAEIASGEAIAAGR